MDNFKTEAKVEYLKYVSSEDYRDKLHSQQDFTAMLDTRKFKLSDLKSQFISEIEFNLCFIPEKSKYLERIQVELNNLKEKETELFTLYLLNPNVYPVTAEGLGNLDARFYSEYHMVNTESLSKTLRKVELYLDHELKEEGLQSKGKQPKKTNLFYIMKLWYERGCKTLQSYEVESMINRENLKSENQVLKKWREVKKNNYRHTDNPNNIKEFKKVHLDLLDVFAPNTAEYKSVHNSFQVLKETYPEY